MSFKRFDGSNFVDISGCKRFDGANWVDAQEVKRFDGANWVSAWMNQHWTITGTGIWLPGNCIQLSYPYGASTGSSAQRDDGWTTPLKAYDTISIEYKITVADAGKIAVGVSILRPDGSFVTGDNTAALSGVSSGVQMFSFSTFRSFVAGNYNIRFNIVKTGNWNAQGYTAEFYSLSVNGVRVLKP